MISLSNLNSFTDIAEEILALLSEGRCLSDTYPLWRRWETLRQKISHTER